jgi:hypothetical protein
MTPSEAPTSRKVWIALLASAVLTCSVAGGGVLWAASRVTSLLSQATWTADAIPRSDLGRVFGVRLRTAPLQYTSRNSGYQEPHLEALLLLPPGSEAAFLEENGLSESPEPPQDTSEAEDQVHELAPATLELVVVSLDGLRHLQGGDGGFVALYRHGALLRSAGTTWVYLVAFGS